MADARDAAGRLAGCYVISLRPVGAHAALRRAAAAYGARVLALSPWTLARRDDAATRAALAAALAAQRVVVTSPAAVHAAAGLEALRVRPQQAWFAVGASTARALHRAGVAEVASPSRMDSEGLLALPGLQGLAGVAIGLLTAPGGRDLISAALQSRGATVFRADVYERVAVAPSARALARLRGVSTATWLALSSGEALQRTLASLPPELVDHLRRAGVVAASPRLAALARSLGFTAIVIAADARPRSLLEAAASAQASSSMQPSCDTDSANLS